MRAGIRRLHLLLAMTVGLFAALSGLTGSILVFHPELDRLLNPDLLRTEPRAIQPRLDAAVTAVHDRFPNATVNYARLARKPGGVYEFWIDDGEIRRVYVDPYSAQILGWRGEHPGILGFIEHLHERLLSGSTGQTALGITGLLLLVIIATGLFLWWPGPKRLRDMFHIRWNGASIRLYYDLHRLVGLASCLLLFLSALTGSALVFHRISAWLLVSSLGGPLPMPISALEDVTSGSAPTASMFVERARTALPGATPTWIQWPSPSLPAFVVRVRFDDNPHPSGTSHVAFDPQTGKVLGLRSHHRAGLGQKLANLRYPLHTGEALGLAGRLAMTLVGLTPTLLLITGLSFWYGRRHAQRKKRQPAAGAAR